MVEKTNTSYAPWLVVPAIIKTSRIEILKYIIRNCEKVLWGVKDY